MYSPLTEGKDHINMYSRSSTALGRLLSNFAYTPFVHPEYGKFASVEGFYFWVSTGFQHHKLKVMSGYGAKQYGGAFPRVELDDFEKKIREAIRLKIEQNPKLKKLLLECDLPIAHYYYYGKPENCKVIELSEHNYMLEEIEAVRTELKAKEDENG